jgi:hypothetical protein
MLSLSNLATLCSCDAYATEFDLEAEEYVPLPKVGGVHVARAQWGVPLSAVA